MKWVLICLCCLMAPVAWAGFSGFPLSDQENTDWNYLSETYHPVSQIVSAINERCLMLNVATVCVTETFSFYAGQTSGVVVVGGYTYTNYCDAYTNILTTNAQPVTYTYTHPVSGSTNVTVYPPVTRYLWYYLDQKLDSIISKFVPTNVTGYAGLNDFFSQNKRWYELWDGSGIWVPTSMYMVKCSKAGLMHDLGIGQSTNFTWWEDVYTDSFCLDEQTNQWAQTGTGDWTLRVMSTQGWHLGECQYTNSDWVFIQSQDAEAATRYGIYQTNIFPVIHYSRNTNDSTSLPVDVNISGTRLTTSNVPESANETITVSADLTPSTNRWIYISNLDTTDAGHTNDTLSLIWTNTLILTPLASADPSASGLGSPDWELSATMLDERWLILKNLVWTYGFIDQAVTHKNIITNKYFETGYTDTLENAIADLRSSWSTAGTTTAARRRAQIYSGAYYYSAINKYKAKAYAAEWEYFVNSFTACTNQKIVDFYLRPDRISVPADTNKAGYVDYTDSSLDFGYIQTVISTDPTSALSVTSPVIGNLDFPEPFRSVAGDTDYDTDGIQLLQSGKVGGLEYVVRWNIPGGLEWY